ncbi:MAG TPA: hypothetical protein VIK99_06310, partial [Thermaerobacter sp.]
RSRGRAVVEPGMGRVIPPLLLPLAGGPLPAVMGVLVVAFFLNGAGLAVSNVHVVSSWACVPPSSWPRQGFAWCHCG